MTSSVSRYSQTDKAGAFAEGIFWERAPGAAENNIQRGDGVALPFGVVFGTGALRMDTVGAVSTGPIFELRKARGTITAPTVVTSGDDIGQIDFYGAVAADEYVRGAQIRADMVGTIATTRGPGTLSFLTATDAAPSVLTVALTLNADQSVTFGGNLVLADGVDLTFTGATGTNDIVLVNGLADALSITDGAADVMVIDTSTAGNVITFTGAIRGDQEITSSSPTAGVGYATGAGGAETQITDSGTAVTLNTITGQITTVALTTAGAAEEVFVVNNSTVAATDTIVLSTTYAGQGAPFLSVTDVGAGVFSINIANLDASALNAVMVINFAVIKAVAA